MVNSSKKLLSSHHPKKHYHSFHYAFSGIRQVFVNERNFRLHIIIALFIIGLGFYYGISATQWIVLTLTIGLVLVCELTNTIVEDLLDIVSPAYSEEVKVLKDIAAGLVLISAIVAIVVGALIFIPVIFL